MVVEENAGNAKAMEENSWNAKTVENAVVVEENAVNAETMEENARNAETGANGGGANLKNLIQPHGIHTAEVLNAS